jgi:GDPmannose 4,6-dehydratase
MNKIALITGISGQSGSYLAELLLEKGYEVHGIIRRASDFNTNRIDHIFKPEIRDYIHFGDLSTGIDNLIYSIRPDEIYNAAAQSHVKVSFDVPVYTGDVNALGVARLLECIHRGIKSKILSEKIKFFQFSSSEMFGQTPTPETGYNEDSIFTPVSSYGCAKLYSYFMTKLYRSGYNMFACNGIMFNKESPRRGPTFVTRKVTRAAARIKLKQQDKLVLGNLDALRDWNHSKDAVKAIYLIMQQPNPEDFVVASGEQHTVKEFVIEVFNNFDLDWEKYVVLDKSMLRPNEVPNLLGDSTKIRKLGWKPEYTFKTLVNEMCQHDFNLEQMRQ